MIVLIFTILTTFLSFADEGPSFPSYKYADLTLEKWPDKTDPPISISDMEIFASNSIVKEYSDISSAQWTKKSVRGLSCTYYDINFQIEDRHGNVILSESKFYSWPKGGGDAQVYNKDRKNVVFSGPDHSARFTKKFHDKLYLTVKYWVSNVKCDKAKTSKNSRVQRNSDRIAFPLEEQLRKARGK